MSEWTKEEMKKALQSAKVKAMQDPNFRSLCIADAAAAVRDISGKDLPGEVKLKFVENDGVHMTIVLPNMTDGEMSEEDLDKVAGGTLSIFACTATVQGLFC